MKHLIRIVAVLFAAAACSAQAAVIDFEDIGEDTEFTDVVSGGFRFVANNFGAIYITDGAACNPPCAANGTRTLFAAGPLLNGNADRVEVTRAAGGSFILSSVDAAEVFSAPFLDDGAALINYQGLLGGVEVTSGSLTLDQVVDGPGGLADFQQFALPGVTVDTFIFFGADGISGNNGFNLDNLVVELVNGPGEVPEPATLALGALGAVAIALGRRRPAWRGGACRRMA